LRRNAHLDEKILGDIQTYRWPVPRFDAVVCGDVPEHLPRPTAALDNLFDAVKPGGIVVLAFPNLYSLKGLVTKLTPFFVHVWFYRLTGDHRPLDEFDQFPTYLRTSMVPTRVLRRGQERGFSVVYFRLYEGPVQTDLRRRSPYSRRVLQGPRSHVAEAEPRSGGYEGQRLHVGLSKAGAGRSGRGTSRTDVREGVRSPSWWNRGHWLKEVDFGTARYIGVDIVAPIGDANRRRYGNDARSFLHLDIVSDALPKADLVLCRDCLVHLSNRKAFQALRNLQASGSDYLATTTQQRSEKRGHHHGGVAAARPHVAALQFAETHHAH